MSTATPPLGRRVVLAGLAVVAAALLAANIGIVVLLEVGRETLLVRVLVSSTVLVLAWLVLPWAARLALRPVSEVAEAAGRTATGQRDGRLRPDRPATELGRLAAAHDAVLESLAAGLEQAAQLERRTGALETRWRQVLEAAQQAYVAVAADGRVVDWNPRAQELFGWPREQAVGLPADQLVAPEHREAFTSAVAELAARGPAPAWAPQELRALRQDGRSFTAEYTVWGVDRRGGPVVHAFVRDVSRRRRTEDALSRLAAVVEGSSDAIITQDLAGTILTWNAAAERMYGWSAAEAVGRPDALIVPPEQRARLADLLAAVARGERAPGHEAERLTRGGIRVPVSIRISPVRGERDEVVAVSTIAQDITEQRWMAETLDTSLAALQQAVEDARISEEATRRFLADAAHQLRTPVAGIRACAETLLRGADRDDADRLLTTMVRETSRAARLISSLLQIARLDQGLPSPRTAVDVVALCADEVERLSLLSPDLQVHLDVRRAPGSSLLLDATGCQEILSNLGDNARRHAQSRIDLVLDSEESQLCLVMSDDGPGVPEEARTQVFERFVSLDGRGGSGLGLPIARALARAMGGDLDYDAGFRLTLPITTGEGDATAS